MRTTVITTALLATMFAGCSKEETKELTPRETSTDQELTRVGTTMVGTYTVLKYTIENKDHYDEMKDLRLFIYRGGACETVVGGVKNKGSYKYDNLTHSLKFSITGNKQSDILSSRVWNVSRREYRTVRLFSDEGNVSLVMYLNYPSEANPL